MRLLSFKELAEAIAVRPARLGDTRLVAVDGRAGSGKSTFSRRLAAAATDDFADVALVHTDDLLPGWVHPTGFADKLDAEVLHPLERREPASYRPYDWIAGRYGEEWRDIGRPGLLVVEGVTSAAERFRDRLTLSVWVRTDPELCLRRGIERDGEHMRGEWETWRRHEVTHFAADGTEAHADVIVDGAPDAPHDPEREFVVIDSRR